MEEGRFQPGSHDFNIIKGKVRQEYFAAVQAGLDFNYTPMETIFRAVVEKTLRQAGEA